MTQVIREETWQAHKPSYVPHKTATGYAEMRARGLSLDSSMRCLLIQIDGEKSVAELQHYVVGNAREKLIDLYAMGLIGWAESLSYQALGTPPQTIY